MTLKKESQLIIYRANSKKKSQNPPEFSTRSNPSPVVYTEVTLGDIFSTAPGYNVTFRTDFAIDFCTDVQANNTVCLKQDIGTPDTPPISHLWRIINEYNFFDFDGFFFCFYMHCEG